MKKTVLRAICIILSFAMMFSLLSESLCASAAAVMTEYTVSWYSPAKVASVTKGTNTFSFVSTIGGKSDIINFELSFPEEGGVRLSTQNKGNFEPEALKKIKYKTVSSKVLLLTAENSELNVTFNYNTTPWSVTYSDGSKSFTASASQMYFGFDSGNVMQKVKLEGALSSGEVIYGLGERYNGLNQVGKKVWLWNTDTGYHTKTSGDKPNSYANVPILHSSKGYTLYFNSCYGGYADIGKSDASKYSLDLNGADFDYYMYLGTPLENIESYTALTGRPIKSPEWAFGYWAGGTEGLWTAGATSSSQTAKDLAVFNNVKSVLNKYKEMGMLPSAVFIENRPLTERVLKLAASYGVKPLAWNNPSVTQWVNSETGLSDLSIENLKSLLPDVAESELPAFYNADKTVRYDYWGDFSNPNMVQALKNGGFKKLIKAGLRGAMVDYGEYVDEWYYAYNGMKGDEMHNYYALPYTKTVNEVFKSEVGDDFILFARAGCAGSQSYGANFGGDTNGSFDGLKASISAGLSMSASGFSTWGSDLGGFHSSSQISDELYQRWLMFSLFSPLMRVHGGQDKNPWSFGEQAQATFKTAYSLRYNMLDLLYSANLTANKIGAPMMQAMALAFPEDETFANVTEQYLFCNELLVCPVTASGKLNYTVYLPEGRWTSLWDGSLLGGGTHTVASPLNRIPVYIREGAVIPMTLSESYSYLEQPKNGIDALVITPAAEAREVSYETADGESAAFESAKSGEYYTVTVKRGSGRKTVMLAGVFADAVTVDGMALPELSSLEGNEIGFYVDETNNRTIVRADVEWSRIRYTDGRALPQEMQGYTHYYGFDSGSLNTDLDDFTVYHSSTNSKTFSAVTASNYLTTADGTLTRITDEGGYSDRDMDRNIVSAVLKTEQFEDVVIDATIQGTAGGASSMGFVVGQKALGAHYMGSANGGYAVFFKRYATAMNIGVAYNGKSILDDGTAKTFGRTTFAGSIENFQEKFGFGTGDKMRVRVSVINKKLTASVFSNVKGTYIDVCKDVPLNSYSGGYIALAQSTAQVTKGAPADQFFDSLGISASNAPVSVLEQYGSAVTLKPQLGYEYSIDGVNFSPDNAFKGLSHNTEYTFYQRFANGVVSATTAKVTVRFLAGDFNGDNLFMAYDLVALRGVLIGAKNEPRDISDVNTDSDIDIRDLVRLKLYCIK